MNETKSKDVPRKRRIRRLLFAAVFLSLFFVLLPGAIKWTVNRAVLPRRFAAPDCPVKSGRLDELRYTGLVVSNLLADAGSGRTVRVSRVEAAYNLWTLMHGRIPLVRGKIISGPDVVFEADITARDIDFSGGGVKADVLAQCSRVTSGDFSAGPFCATARMAGSEGAMTTEIPLQDGLLRASVDAQVAGLPTNPVWTCAVRVPLAAADGSPVQLGGLVSGVDSLLVSGLVQADISGGKSGTEAVLSLAVGSLDFPAHSLSLSNLNAACTMRFPGELRSQPGQGLTADSLSVGKLRLDQIRMHYQLEPDSTVFLEDLEFNWCGGRVSLYSARFGPDSTNVSVRLFCDRLSLEQVLAACGLTGFSAGGELNGRLPVQWTKNGLSIDRGFLFTTPGKGGTFSLGGTKAAAGLLPPGSLEEGQIGLVTAALASFNYDWITMTLNSEGENLRIEIEASGQPVNVLPYEYDSRSGTYVKIDLRPGRGIRQPMSFKLNLTVPLNQLLCYASGINKQWNLFKGQP
ncbi:MAG: YdbH domain-containing protein [Kiritimatiellales bacterium]